MKKKKTTRTIELTFERNEFFAILRRKSYFAQCPECGGRVPMVTPEEATRIAGVMIRTIYSWVEANRVHFRETPEGLLLICLYSLSR